jgi:hypothetical protein
MVARSARARTRLAWPVAALLLTTSCASVPKEAVELSTLVGEQITSVQASHEAFVSEYFRVSRERLEDFLQYRWVPEFMTTFVRDADLIALLEVPEPFDETELARLEQELAGLGLVQPGEAEVLAAVKRALGDEERGQILLEFAQAAIEQIEAQRRELLDPLDALELETLEVLRETYADLGAAQASVTAYLHSVRDVAVERDRILEELDLLEARGRAVTSAVSLNDSIQDLLARSGEAEDTILEIRRLLGADDD